MTAETLTATRAADSFPVYQAQGSGAVCAAYGTYEVAANVEDGDIFEMCKVPAGARILGGWYYADDMDTNASETLDMDIGWAANGGTGTWDSATPTGLGNLGVSVGDAFATPNIGATAGTIAPLQGVLADGDLPYFTKETTIQVEANAVAATFAAGAISVVVLYVVDESLVA